VTATAQATPEVIPAVVPTVPAELPTVVERTLANGLRVMVVRRTTVPLVELRLRIPFAGAGDAHRARAELLAETLFTGTADRDRLELASAVQAIGGAMSAIVDADRLAVVGSALANRTVALLEILAEVLTGATYPTAELAGERDRLVEEVTIAYSQPSVIAREALLRRMFGDHPYGRDTPLPETLRAVSDEEVRSLHGGRVSPAGAVLTLVGDLEIEPTLDAVEKVLGGWTGEPSTPTPPAPRPIDGPIVIIDRPGAVQTNIRLAGVALDRADPRYPAQQLASIAFGGYFSSRLVSNIREDKGYTYSPRSAVEHLLGGSRFTVGADVATDVTAAALLEIQYELGRMAVLPIGADELDAARRYAAGTLALSTATAAGLASTLSSLSAFGIGVEYLRDHPIALEGVSLDDVRSVAAGVLAPARLVTVLVGDAATITPVVAALGTVEAAAQED
jgi:predicted Zn-dependent peptidase